MNYIGLNLCDMANGPGCRVSLFVSGCTLHCKGCFNRKSWNFNAGLPFTKETHKRSIHFNRRGSGTLQTSYNKCTFLALFIGKRKQNNSQCKYNHPTVNAQRNMLVP